MTTSIPQKFAPTDPLIQELLGAFDRLDGVHPGFRTAHAKGVMCSGTFTPAAGATELTRAPHIARPSTPIVVRFSDFAGVPSVADNDPKGASPRGMAIRFQLAEHVHTDIIAHSADGFPASNAEDFLGFLRAAAASGPEAPHPTPIEQFLGSHPHALAFVMMPKPFPTSFARESFFGRAPYRFTNATGVNRLGRFRIRPVAGNEYLAEDDAAKKSANYLMDEIASRLSRQLVEFQIVVQIAGDGDAVDDVSADWPASREEIAFGKVTLTKMENQLEPELRKMIFDPIPRVDGIDASDDPLLEIRAAIYLASGRRRRAATPTT
jgi:catalase